MRIIEDEELSALAYELLSNPLQHLIWQANLNISDITKNFPPSFWRDVLECWNGYKEKIKETTEFRHQIIWLNSDIRIGNKIVFWNKWYESGIITIDQLMQPKTARFLTNQEFQNKYPALSILDFYSITSAIKGVLKSQQQIISEESQDVQPAKQVIRPTHQIYTALISKSNPLHEQFLKFAHLWKVDPSIANYEEYLDWIVKIPRLTIITKYRSFQYRLLCLAILTNIRLQHMGVKSSSMCDFCQEKTETYLHLFWECTHSQRLWNKIAETLKVALTKKMVILNNVKENPKAYENTVVLFVKYYIFQAKCLNAQVSTTNMIKQIESQIVIEKEIASAKGKLSQHQSKWEECKIK